MYTEEDFDYPYNIAKDIPLSEEIEALLTTIHRGIPYDIHSKVINLRLCRKQITKIVNEYESKNITELQYCVQISKFLCSCYEKSINEATSVLFKEFPGMFFGREPKSLKNICEAHQQQVEKKAKHKQACQKGQRKSAEKKREYKEQVKNTYMSINEIENMCLKRAYDRLKSEHEKRYGVLHRKESTLYKWISEFEKEKSRIQNSSHNI